MGRHSSSVHFDWMNDTACCFGYPLDTSRTARKWTGSLGWAGPHHWSAPPSDARPRQRSTMLPPPPRRPPRAAGHGADCPGQSGPGGSVARCHQPRPPARTERCSQCSLSHGRRQALPASRRPWMSAGLPGAAMDRRHERHGRPRKGRQWGGVRAGAAAGGSPSAS
jgi:hypothetical protein